MIPDLFTKDYRTDPIFKYCSEKIGKRIDPPTNYWHYPEAKDFFKRICVYEVWEEVLAEYMWENYKVDLMQLREILESL